MQSEKMMTFRQEAYLFLNINKVFLSTNESTSYYLKNNIKIYIKIAPTCFGAVTPSSVSSLSVLAKVTVF
jgi:hypothetical protein